MRRTGFLLCWMLSAVLISTAGLNAQERVWRNETRSIEQISEHVYRWGSDNQYGAFILTDEGIIVIDGHYCDSGTAQWFKSELDSRYDVPVRYVILSHDHQDHNCHTGIFSDTAVGIGHVNIVPHLVGENRNSIIPSITFEEEMDLPRAQYRDYVGLSVPLPRAQRENHSGGSHLVHRGLATMPSELSLRPAAAEVPIRFR